MTIRREILSGMAIVAVFVVLFSLLAYGLYYDSQQNEKEVKEEVRQFQLANTICGSPPRDIQTHGPGWSHGAWMEVKCKDGTVRAIR